MMRISICKNCRGAGSITVITGDKNDYCGVATQRCPVCSGYGSIPEADADSNEIRTYGDMIRGMNDRQLATFAARKLAEHERVKTESEGRRMTATENATIAETYFRVLMQWLRTPVEDRTWETTM